MTLLIQLSAIFVLSFIAYKFIVRKRNLKNCLPNKVVLITGASSGIGEALAHVFYIAGCRLILTARRKDELERVRKELLQTYSTKVTHPPVVMTLDVTDLKSLKKTAEKALNIHGHVDILVNNSGIYYDGEVVNTKHEDDMKVMMTNYFGTVELTKAFLPSMIKNKKGKIVCISSVLGKFAIPMAAPYVASKFAMEGFCDCLRAEVHDYNIKVMVISPGLVKTNVSKNAIRSDGKKKDEEMGGMNVMDFAYDAVRAVMNDEKDVIISQFYVRVFYWIKLYCSELYYLIILRHARDERKKKEKSL